MMGLSRSVFSSISFQLYALILCATPRPCTLVREFSTALHARRSFVSFFGFFHNSTGTHIFSVSTLEHQSVGRGRRDVVSRVLYQRSNTLTSIQSQFYLP